MTIMFKDFNDSRELSTPTNYIETLAKKYQEEVVKNKEVNSGEVEQFVTTEQVETPVVETPVQESIEPEVIAQEQPQEVVKETEQVETPVVEEPVQETVQPEAIIQEQPQETAKESEQTPVGNIFDAPSTPSTPSAPAVEQPAQNQTTEGNIFDAPSSNQEPAVNETQEVEAPAVEEVSVEPEPIAIEKQELEPINVEEQKSVIDASEIGVEEEKPKEQSEMFPEGFSTVHRINEGDNVYNLSSKWGIPADEILEANALNPNTDLVKGELLIVPSSPDKMSRVELEQFSKLAQKVEAVLANQKTDSSGAYNQLLDIGEMTLNK